jgi:hypothetical protein
MSQVRDAALLGAVAGTFDGTVDCSQSVVFDQSLQKNGKFFFSNEQ